jgi:hypothetical protein
MTNVSPRMEKQGDQASFRAPLRESAAPNG